MTATVPALLEPMKDRLAAATWSDRVESAYRALLTGDMSGKMDMHELAESALLAAGVDKAPTDQAKLIAAIEGVLAVADRWEEDFPHKAWQVRAALTQALGGDTA